ncbi:DUF1344 domain-containing protein [Rhizobium sp. TRM95111]|uniref:DUF1344 domain-containing protein n=1 Tax=Rhizobium alarense TaxID=2846851 RepID=UPI001F47BC2B|nr:DUF1344 domain-containing protein [Rhizobium alarense]MCF3638514.1 DUF1344 domain-containing protein [Rhizobium alarense]
MRVLLSNLAIVTVLTTPAFALAAQTATGTVKEYSPAAMSLTLADGTMYRLPPGFNDPRLKAGDTVRISYDPGTKHLATGVTIIN